jgi:hypothetical protein
MVYYLQMCLQEGVGGRGLEGELSFCSFKGKYHEIFCFRYFSLIIFPQAPENNIKISSKFSKIRRDILKSRCTTGINDTGGKLATGVNDSGSK